MKQQKRIKKRSQKREQKGAKEISGRAHVASGALWFKKGDFSNEHFLVEDKFTDKDAYSISLTTLRRIEKQAMKVLKVPVLCVGFERIKYDIAILRKKDLSSGSPFFITETKRKSMRVKDQAMKQLFLNNTKQPSIVQLDFIEEEQINSYCIMEWFAFVEHQALFLC